MQKFITSVVVKCSDVLCVHWNVYVGATHVAYHLMVILLYIIKEMQLNQRSLTGDRTMDRFSSIFVELDFGHGARLCCASSFFSLTLQLPFNTKRIFRKMIFRRFHLWIAHQPFYATTHFFAWNGYRTSALHFFAKSVILFDPTLGLTMFDNVEAVTILMECNVKFTRRVSTIECDCEQRCQVTRKSSPVSHRVEQCDATLFRLFD